MVFIITGHMVGILLPLMILKNIPIEAAEDGGKTITYLAVSGLILFIEYQIFTSITSGRLYFRGTIDEFDGSRFKVCQFTYSILGGFMITVLFQNIF